MVSVSSIPNYSKVAFGQTNTTDKVTQELINKPGDYTQTPTGTTDAPADKPKKGGLVSAVAKLIVAAAVIGGGAVAARKFVPALKDIKVVDELAEGATKTDKLKNGFAKYTDKLIDFVESIPAKFKKAPKADEAPAVDTVA